MHEPAGLDTKHDSAAPAETVPVGQLVAIVIFTSLTATYPDGQLVPGAAAKSDIGIKKNKNNKSFIHPPLIGQIGKHTGSKSRRRYYITCTRRWTALLTAHATSISGNIYP